MDTKESNRFKQQCFEAEKKQSGLKAVKIYLSKNDIEKAKSLFINIDDTRKNTQRDAVTKSFEVGLQKQDDMFNKNSLLQSVQLELSSIKQQYIEMEQGFNQRIKELELNLRSTTINLENERNFYKRNKNK